MVELPAQHLRCTTVLVIFMAASSLMPSTWKPHNSSGLLIFQVISHVLTHACLPGEISEKRGGSMYGLDGGLIGQGRVTYWALHQRR